MSQSAFQTGSRVLLSALFVRGLFALVMLAWFNLPSTWAADPAKPVSAAATFSQDDFAKHLEKLKAKTPPGFAIVVQPPFVVIGDDSENAVRRYALGTVKWAVDRLKQDFFARDPEAIIDIWLFKNEASYNRYTRQLFNDAPDTPFGYYSTTHNALIMNIGTGGGTLVHEIVHPFVRANLPDCPAWFNEGLGSLFEQSGERNGHIVGRTNWRLPALQQAITRQALPSFPKMMAMTDAEFYGRSRGASYSQHYAQARYLCYYLQEKGLLVKFYRDFAAHIKDDPTGIKSLKRTLGEEDLEAFKEKWETFVLKLRFG